MDGTLPTTDEQQLFTWKDATLREVVSTLRNTAPHVPEYRHPLARFSFRTVYADSSTKGRFSQKDLGIVYSRDILGEPGALGTTAPRLLEDTDDAPRAPADPEKAERTLDELRFVPGDYLLVAVLFPQRVNLGTELNIKGSATAAPASNGWKAAAEKGTGRGGDAGWGAPLGPAAAAGRGGGHWRGDSNAPRGGGRGRGIDRDSVRRSPDRDADRDRDRRAPPPRRDSPPHRGGGDVGWGSRGGRGDRRSRSPPPRRRGPRYD